MKTLFIDYDFINVKNGASTRSKFLLRTLLETSCVDLLTLDPEAHNKAEVVEVYGVDHVFYALTESERKYFSPDNLTSFSDNTIRYIIDIVGEQKYDTIFVRFYVHDRLIQCLKKTFPEIKIIVDVDLLFSNYCFNVFLQKPILKTRYYFFQYLKHKVFQQQIFEKKLYFFVFKQR